MFAGYAGDFFRLEIDQRPFDGARLSVFYSPDLTSGSWLDIGAFTDSALGFEDHDASRTEAESGFYRIQLLPDLP